MKIDKKYLPSKNFLIALSAAIIIVVLAIIFNYWKPSTTKIENNNLVVAGANASSSAMDIDSDNDGLPDWKEALYGTNPHNPDTDGDGTPDGMEVAENRDPLKANTAPKGQQPNDMLDPALIAKDQAMTQQYESLNATQKMAEDLMSNIIASQPASGEIDQDTQDSIVQQSLQDLPQKTYNGITTESDLNLIPINPQTFNNDLAIYTKSYFAETESYRKIEGQDLTIINTYLSAGTDDKAGMKKITVSRI